MRMTFKKKEKEVNAELFLKVDLAAALCAESATAVSEATAHLFNTRPVYHATHNESYALRCKREAVSRASKNSRDG